MLKICSSVSALNYFKFSFQQVMMIRGLFSDWKQPIFAGFDVSMKIELLLEAISKSYEVGFEVVATVSDCGGGNTGIWSKPNENETFLRHPLTNRKVFLFADAPHLLKLARNWLIDTGFLLADGTLIKHDPLKSLVIRKKTEISDTFFIRQELLTCERNQRQKVDWAAKIYSRKCAIALQRRVRTPDAIQLSHFILIMNNWWDIFNSRHPNESQTLKRPYGLHLSEQDEALRATKELMRSCVPTNKRSPQVLFRIVYACLLPDT